MQSGCQSGYSPNAEATSLRGASPIQVNGDEAAVRSMCREAARGPNGRYYRNNGMAHLTGPNRIVTAAIEPPAAPGAPNHHPEDRCPAAVRAVFFI